MKVAVASRSFSAHPLLQRELKNRYPEAKFNLTGKSLSGSELIEFLSGASAAITALEKIDLGVLSRLPDLKLISKYGVGTDMLDLKAFQKMGVKLGWSGGVNKRSVAELALLFALFTVRNAGLGATSLKNSCWSPGKGRELSGKTIGIVGFGHVGQEFARLLAPFGCPIWAHDVKDLKIEIPAISVPFEQKSLEDLLAGSDLISLHIPLTHLTKNLFNSKILKKMKDGAILLNTSRGGIVDEIALLEGLESGKLAAAAFDVFGNEPPQEWGLIRHPHFFGTPHIGGSTEESILAMGRAAIENLENGQKVDAFSFFQDQLQ